MAVRKLWWLGAPVAAGLMLAASSQPYFSLVRPWTWSQEQVIEAGSPGNIDLPIADFDGARRHADLEVLWQALVNMWDLDRSASRGLTACRALYVFSHSSPLGNAPAHKLFDRLKISRRAEITVPRQWADYTVIVQDADLPQGVTLTRMAE